MFLDVIIAHANEDTEELDTSESPNEKLITRGSTKHRFSHQMKAVNAALGLKVTLCP